MAISNIISTTIQELDANGQTLARRVASVSDTAATVGQFIAGNLINTNQTSITLPILQVRQLWVHNTDSAATLTVIWTPNGGTETTTGIVLGPTDQIMFWHTTTGSTKGISSLKLTASEANATFEVFVGG